MSKLFITTILVLIGTFSAFPQDTASELDSIREWFREINTDINQYTKVTYPDIKVYKDTNPEHYSMEGEKIYRLATVDMTKFFEDDQLVKIALRFNGDREDLTSEYYLKNNSLFFVDKVKTIYHKPKWDDTFQESEKSIAKNRFYIEDNQLIRWINTDMNSVEKTDPAYSNYETMILNDYRLYSSID